MELRLRAYGRVRKNLVLAVVSRFALAAALLMLAVDGAENWYAVVGVFLLMGLGSLVSLVIFQLRWGRWSQTATELLRSAVTRRVTAEVISAKGKTVVLALDGGQLHVRAGLYWEAREVVVRTGEVWLAGPDANGMVVLFVDGLPVPVHGQPVAEVPDRAAPAPRPDDLTASFARRFAAVQWIPIGISLVFIGAFSYDVTDRTYRQVVGSLLIVLLVVGLVRILPVLKLPALVKAGNWQSYQATMHAWKGDPKLVGDLGVTITYPDGGVQPVVVRYASAELVANISNTGLLWVAGTPAPGVTLAVGVPGYPIAAAAKFVENAKLHS